jgi:FixJ family two-component response regulator
MTNRVASPDDRLTVFVVDDDDDVRHALGLLLGLRGYRTALFPAAEPFLAALQAYSTGCLITDIRMPGMSGLELQGELARRGVALPVVVLTAHGDVDSARTALRARAIDFLGKPFKEADLIGAVEMALECERSRLTLNESESAAAALIATLTLREREVMVLLATGAQNVKIAQQLNVSPRTVEIHKARGMEKLQLRTLADLVRFVDRTGMNSHP